MKSEWSAVGYDALHGEPKLEPRTVRHSFYYPLFREVVAEVRRREARAVLEVGCGSGWLASMLVELPSIQYSGFDFSRVGVEKTRKRTGISEGVYLGDARDPGSYGGSYDTIVCTEVLEHIERDLDVIRLWRPGVNCICSVPNFDYPSHVRVFRNEGEVLRRYGSLIEIERIVRIRRPPLRGHTPSTYFRNLRWSRDRPKTMLGMLGINTFDWYAGWFVFSGRCATSD